MSLATELDAYLETQGVDTNDPWYRMPIFGRRVKIFRLEGRLKDGFRIHDAHHLVAGYDTSWKGEAELCAWELASGGCHTYGAFWLDRVLFAPIAVLLAPIRFTRAFFRGLSCRNLYRVNVDELMAMDLGDARQMARLRP